ncbi:hypothetical protein DFQ30_004880 [Apophysomyces sp. BC1015]|nr:hypothetical protein DFQ30_004880 [Apophysomyces sp. BC1015]KAG0180071.1 hypothetical protein DFQ29_001253 [Apophysomyces sp. BC1021]
MLCKVKQTATSSSTRNPPKKKQHVLAADIQWCINNKDNRTLKSFTDEFGHEKRYHKITDIESTADTDAAAATVATDEIIVAVIDTMKENMENPASLAPWFFKGMDVPELLAKFRQGGCPDVRQTRIHL